MIKTITKFLYSYLLKNVKEVRL